MNWAFRRPRRPVVRIVFWVVAVGAALAIFDVLSALSEVARRGWLVSNPERFARPPIYGQFAPQAGRWTLVAVATLAVAAGLAWLAGRPRGRNPAFVAAGVLVLFGFAVAVAFIGGERTEAAAGTTPEPNAPVIDRVGVTEFVRTYPDRYPDGLQGIHTLSHPPGRPVLGWLLQEAFGDDALGKAIALAAASSLVVVPLWLLAREHGDERSARYAVALVVTAPGPVMFAFASIEAVEAVAIATAAFLMLRALRRDGDARWAAAAGAVLGATLLFTYSAAIVAAFLGLYAALARPGGAALRAILGAAAGGIAALVAMRLAIGFDPYAASRAAHEFFSGLPPCPIPVPPDIGPCYLQRSYVYWLAGAPAAWLTFAGVPLAALGLRELVRGRSRLLIALLVPVAIFYALPRGVTGLFPGELERTVLWAVPIVAAVAGAALARLAAERGAQTLTVILAVVAGGQTIVIEALYRTGW